MKIFILTLFLLGILVLPLDCLAQKPAVITAKEARKDPVLKEIREIRTLLNQYSGLSPFGNNRNEPELIDSIRNQIFIRLLDLLNRPGIDQYPIETLLAGEPLLMTYSPDKRLFLITLDEMTGGTFHSAQTLVHYRPPGHKPWAEMTGDPGYFGDIYLVDSLRPLYFTISEVQTCSTCISSSANTLEPDSTSLVWNGLFSYEGRMSPQWELNFDPKTLEFRYRYQEVTENEELPGPEYFRVFWGCHRYIDGRFWETEAHITLENTFELKE